MKFISPLAPIIALSAPGLLLTSCFSNPGSDYLAGIGGPVQRQTSGEYHKPPAIPDDVSYWDGDGVQGSPLVKINRAQQKAFFYKGGVLVGVSRISSGDEDHGTPPGTYKITEKDKDHGSSVYGVFKDAAGHTIDDDVDIRVKPVPPGAHFVKAPMPNFMRFNGGVGMHTGYLPGYAASHGCVRMPNHMAEKFFENTQVGTPVIVE
ncbi:L,D-transpeptidase family protein [Luteolibacter pohnpeiensis]|nr:L,D-transpeptidase family protein [Luteolibacter pohnpeiensis]